MPRARTAAIRVKGEAARAGTKTIKPYHRKNRIVHQAAMDLGMLMFILISPLVVLQLAGLPTLINKTHKF